MTTSIENKIKEYEEGILGFITQLENKCLIYDETDQSKIHLIEEVQHLRAALKQLENVKSAQNVEDAFGRYLPQLTSNTVRMNYFSNNYLTYLENVREDIISVGLKLPQGKVCDFGCGQGFTTISLMSVLNNDQVLGIDNNETVVEQARNWFDVVKRHLQLFEESQIQSQVLIQGVHNVLKTPSFPEFIKGDVFEQDSLPADIDLAYCRKFLVNIFVGSYEKAFLGDEAIKLVIRNIVEAIKPGGWFLAVEEYSSTLDFCRFFDQFNLKAKKIIHINKGGVQMVRYFYQKPFPVG